MKSRKILKSGWNVSSECVEGKIQCIELEGTKGRKDTGEIIILKINVLKGGNGGDIRRKSSVEIVGSETEDLKSIELSDAVGWDGTSESDARKMDADHTASIYITRDTNPRGANRGSSIPVELSGMWDGVSKVKQGLLIGVQISNNRRKDRKYSENENRNNHGDLELHGYFFSMLSWINQERPQDKIS